MTGEEEKELELIPRSIRDKLDRVGIKLHLKDWRKLSLADRRRLRDLPCDSRDDVARYAGLVEQLIIQVTGAPPPRLKIGA